MKRHTLTILTSILLLAGSASSAFALGQNECQTNSDCADAYVCVESVSACTAPPCEPGKECPQIDCDPVIYRYCEPAPPESCETTADCDGGLVCLTVTNTTCNGGAAPDIACSSDGECTTIPAPPEDSDCEETQASYCVPPYLAPCTTDESCGEGFSCEVAPVSCGCSAPGGSSDPRPIDTEDVPDSADAGRDNSDDFDNTTDCGCPEPDESVRYCELENVSCTADEECSGDFICHRLSSPTPDSSCSFDPSTGVETCEEFEVGDNEPPLGRCAPADYPYWMNQGGGSRGDANYDSENQSHTGAPRDASNSLEQDNQNDDGGCHIASLNTANTSTTALLLAGVIGLFTFGRRRKR